MTDTIIAKSRIRGGDEIVETAQAIATEALRSLGASSTVEIDLRGVSGVPSSFFNVILLTVAGALGAAALDRVHFVFDSPAQESRFRRSLDAVRNQPS